MALSTKVNIAYRSPWVPDMPHPDEETIKLMKYEIKRMRQDLVRKQKRLKASPEYSSNYNERAMSFFQSSEAMVSGKTDRQIQNLWSRLRSMQLSNSFSISGLKQREQNAIDTLRVEYGFEDMSRDEFKKFGQFMEWARGEYELEDIDSDRLVEFYKEHIKLDLEDIQNAFGDWYERELLEEQSHDWDEGTEVNIEIFKEK